VLKCKNNLEGTFEIYYLCIVKTNEINARNISSGNINLIFNPSLMIMTVPSSLNSPDVENTEAPVPAPEAEPAPADTDTPADTQHYASREPVAADETAPAADSSDDSAQALAALPPELQARLKATIEKIEAIAKVLAELKASSQRNSANSAIRQTLSATRPFSDPRPAAPNADDTFLSSPRKSFWAE